MAAVERSKKPKHPLYDELRKAREVGVSRALALHPLPELRGIAATICADTADEVERVECALKKAAHQFEGGYRMGLEILWGLTPQSRRLDYEGRWEQALGHFTNKPTRGAWEKRFRELSADDLTEQLLQLHQQSQTSAPPKLVSAPPFWRRRRLQGMVIACLLTAAGIYLASQLVLSTAATVPPEGTIIDATTGNVVDHVGAKITPQNAVLTGGTIFEGCVFTQVSCTYLVPSKPLRASIGDTIEFSVRLFDSTDHQLPYVRLYTHTYISSQGPGTWIAVSVRWPALGNHIRELPFIQPVEVIFPPTARLADLTYIPGSTVLFGPHHDVFAHLPDGIMERGIALANVGTPASCSYCETEYLRFVNFKVQVTNRGEP